MVVIYSGNSFYLSSLPLSICSCPSLSIHLSLASLPPYLSHSPPCPLYLPSLSFLLLSISLSSYPPLLPPQVVPAGAVPILEGGGGGSGGGVGGGSSPSDESADGGMEGKTYRSKEQLMLRANSLKKALRQIIEQAEKGTGANNEEEEPVALATGGMLVRLFRLWCFQIIIINNGLNLFSAFLDTQRR